MTRAIWVAVLGLCACSESFEEPLPSIASVTPQRVSRSECALLAVELEGVLPVKLDYGKDSAEVGTRAQVAVSGRGAPVVRTEEQGRRLITHLQEGLPVGMHEVSVTLEDGRQTRLPAALEITPPLVIEAFRFDPIVNQIRQEPFTITLRATGQDAHLFQGRVQLRSNKGKLEPEWSEPFQQGVLVQEVTVDVTGGNNILIEMTDCAGRMANSNEFRLDAKP